MAVMPAVLRARGNMNLRRVNRLCAKINESCGFFIFIFPLSTEMKAMTTVTAMKKGLIRKDFKDRD